MAMGDTFRDRLIDPIGTGFSGGTPMASSTFNRPIAAGDTYGVIPSRFIRSSTGEVQSKAT